MLLEYIENLRSKPYEVRKNYTLVFAISITAFVVLIWIASYFLGILGTRTPASLLGKEDENTNQQSEPTDTADLFNKSNAFLNDGASDTGGTQGGWVQELQNFDSTSTSPTGIEQGGNGTEKASSSLNVFNKTN